ncbi:MAG TPA: TauD/TfdA family dioxygenase [Silvibacterium sp.]|jgi:alpha-ketoglutarate-dependent taurine dioxygenase|nr:TauD/TfdA family dioxygenase [Silvibacterium sp.]
MIIADDSDEELLSVDRNTVVTYFKMHGAVLFRSFSIGVEKLQAFVKAYSKAQISYPGNQRAPISPDGTVQTVDVSAGPIPLHSELSHTPFRPDVCWFYCVTAPTSGSETILCDGSLLASELPVSIVQLFESNMLRYRRTTTIAFLERLLGIKGADALREFLNAGSYGQFYEMQGKEVRQDFVAPALREAKFLDRPVFANNIIHNYRPGKPLLYPTFANGSIIPEDLVVTLQQIAQRYTFEIQWRDDDLLMFDNTRLMHGRHAIADSRRTIWTQFSDANF